MNLFSKLRILLHKMNTVKTWNDCRTTLEDIQLAMDWLPVLQDKTLSKTDRTEYQEMIWWCIGIKLPHDILTLIKQYLLLPPDIYKSKKTFIDRVYSSSIAQSTRWLKTEWNVRVTDMNNSKIPIEHRKKTLAKCMISNMNIEYTRDNTCYETFNQKYSIINKAQETKLFLTQTFTLGQEVLYKYNDIRRKGVICSINPSSVTIHLYTFLRIEDVDLRQMHTQGYDSLVWLSTFDKKIVVRDYGSIYIHGKGSRQFIACAFFDEEFEIGRAIVNWSNPTEICILPFIEQMLFRRR